ncbi:hypothetical protein [Streptomyces sp. NBC_00690]|uniref:hypothetical protein n=1 Tax=Streptomyces sp. NBC_00690 TaxID=2975808 RepID=UPI002E2AEC24|nr:hypothetical protein [Streptomyces sp. NBC_00690]
MGRTGTTRRRALVVTAAATAGSLAGCSDGGSEPDTRARAERAAQRRAEADATLRKRLAAASGALRDQYDATVTRHPQLAGRLTALRGSVSEHVTAFGGTGRTAPPPTVPDDPAGALRALATAERHIADAHTAALVDAEPELARLLASVAAAGAAHTYLLTAPAPSGVVT